MDKRELAAILASQEHIAKAKASRIIDAIGFNIVKTVAAGDKVTISNFGVFEPRVRPERNQHSLKNGGTVNIPKSTTIRFRPSPSALSRISRRANDDTSSVESTPEGVVNS